jgi:anthranilate/para-aminobenzoate synthase component II
MARRKVYVVGGDHSYCNFLIGYEIVSRMEDATLVMLTGGSDVSPELYGKKAHPTTSPYPRRDREEVAEFKRAKNLGLPMIGICRGAQAICCFSGGLLVQDMSHKYIHQIETNDGRKLVCNSMHHQMQYPFNLPADQYEVIAWAINEDGGHKLSPYAFGESDLDDMSGVKEIEIAYYYGNGHRCLAIQCHPECLYPPREEWQATFLDYCRELIVKYLES